MKADRLYLRLGPLAEAVEAAARAEGLSVEGWVRLALLDALRTSQGPDSVHHGELKD